MIREVLKTIKDSTSEIDIMDAMSDICNSKHYKVYEFPTPTMVRGCSAFLAEWEEKLE